MSLASKLGNLEVDPTFNLPKLTADIFHHLTILPAGTATTNVRKVVINNIKLDIFNNAYIKEYAYKAVNMSLGTPSDYASPTTAVPDQIYLPSNFSGLVTVINNTISVPGVPNVYILAQVERQHLAHLISFFSVYPEFGPVYEEYMENPDACITTTSREITYSQSNSRQGTVTKNDLRMTAHLLILLMTKNFNSQTLPIREYVNKYLENRAKAAKFMLDDESAKWLINVDGLENMSSLWNTVPKLKEAIFYFLFRVRGSRGEMSAAISLLGEASMITIKCIQKFIETDKKTLAHMDRQIWNEISQFLGSVTQIRAEIGAMWPYYRIIRPKDTTLSAQNFPNLARAAVLYYKTYIDTSPTFARVFIPTGATIVGLDGYVQTPLDEKHLLSQPGQQGELNANERKVVQTLGIDMAKWETPSKLKAKLHMNTGGINNDILLQFMNFANDRRTPTEPAPSSSS
ncbi:putative nucleoprotein [Gudgenby Calliphora mononega-like virus]|uniref:Putative nucleoprotein n=1 Tax=Gudgenby Calliphora mononega-like virus TaxID=2716744 RepID=A0A6G7PSJ4_9MONO|nr:putative nucleoprotein [Gudgenby Calliphora mononega-like virus]